MADAKRMTASIGLPNLGIVIVDEVAFFIRQIVRTTGLPLWSTATPDTAKL